MSTQMDDVLSKAADALEPVQALLSFVEDMPGTEPRALAIARTNFETGFLWFANAIDGEGILS